MLHTRYQTPENKRRLDNLYKAIISAPFVDIDGRVYLRQSGNSSGQACTTPDNVFKNYMDIFCLFHLCLRFFAPAEVFEAWCKLSDSAKHELFRKAVILSIVGDDVVMTVHVMYRDYFNLRTIFAVAHHINMEYTSEYDGFRDFKDVDFLGHTMRVVAVPGIGIRMALPVPNVVKMRHNMLIFNSHKGKPDQVPNCIVRACSLRNETFVDPGARQWFSSLIDFLRNKYGASVSPAIKAAWRSYKTDAELWALYTGFKLEHGRVEPVCVKPRRDSSSLNLKPLPVPQLQSFVMTKTKAQKARLKEAKSAAKGVEKKVVAKVAKTVLKGKGDYIPTKFHPTVASLKGKGDYRAVIDTAADVAKGIGGAVTGLAKIFGFGDYRVKGPRANSLSKHNNGAIPINNPEALMMGNAAVQFGGNNVPNLKHREFVADVVQLGPDFGTVAYRIQPGIRGRGSIMPWASTVARSFQQWRLRGGVFEYVPQYSSSGFNTGAMPMVMMSTLYDAGADNLESEEAVNNNEYTTTCTADKSFIHPLECAGPDNTLQLRYVRADNSISATDTADERFDDMGVFQVSISGGDPAVTYPLKIGQLWFSYDMDLLKPRVPDLHEGTSWGQTVHFTPFGTPSYQPWAGCSLPVEFDPGMGNPQLTGSFTIGLPAGYAGSYLCVVVRDYNNEYTWSGTESLANVGPDITSLAMLPGDATTAKQAYQVCPDNGFSTGAGILNRMTVFTFTTTGEHNGAGPDYHYANKFTLRMPWHSVMQNEQFTFLITALDSSLNCNVLDVLRRRVARQFGPEVAQAILSATSPAPSPNPQQPKLCAPASSSSTAAASSSLATPAPQGAPTQQAVAAPQEAIVSLDAPSTTRSASIEDLTTLDLSTLPSDKREEAASFFAKLKGASLPWAGNMG